MALLRHGIPSSLAAPGGEQRTYLHSVAGAGTGALPRHPGKYIVESSPETSSRSDDEGQSPGGEAADTPFSLAHPPAAAAAAAAANHHYHLPHNHQHQQRGHTVGEGGGGSGGVEQQRSRLELIREAPFPHRWPSRRRRKCRSLGYLAIHAPTIEEEEEGRVRPSSLSPVPQSPGAAAAAATGVQQLHGGQSPHAAGASGALFPQQALPQPPQQQQQQPLAGHVAQPQGHTPASVQPASAMQRMGSLPKAGAPRALQKPLQAAAAAAAAAAAGKAGQSRPGQPQRAGGQPSAKKARTSGAPATGGGGTGKPPGKPPSKPPGKPPVSKQPSKPVGNKPPGKPPYKPSASQQQQQQPPVRRPSSVTLDHHRSSSAAGPGAGGSGGGGGGNGRAMPSPMGIGPRAGNYANLGAAGQEFPIGQLVWAKMPSYPWWPAQVQMPQPQHLGIKHGATDVFVVFYGTADFTWVPRKDVKTFTYTHPDYAKHASVRNKSLQKAIDEAWVALGRPRPDVQGKPLDPGAS